MIYMPLTSSLLSYKRAIESPPSVLLPVQPSYYSLAPRPRSIFRPIPSSPFPQATGSISIPPSAPLPQNSLQLLQLPRRGAGNILLTRYGRGSVVNAIILENLTRFSLVLLGRLLGHGLR
jgi:hypothetical protein